MSTLVHHFLHHTADVHPQKTALVCGDERVSYARLLDLSVRLGRVLNARGISRGDRMLILLPNSIAAAVAVFGILEAGGVFVPLNPGLKGDRLAYIASDSGAKGIVTDGHGLSLLAPHLESLDAMDVVVSAEHAAGLPAGELSVDDLILDGAGVSVAEAMRSDDVACLIYTSGSTGEPKGVVCGHDNVRFAVASITTYLRNTEDDVVLETLPFSFDYGLYQLLMTVSFGGTLVIENAARYPAALLRTIEREGVTGLPIVPTLATMLTRLDLSEFDLSSLRYVTSTADVLPPRSVRQLQAALPAAEIYSMYGLTECKRALFLPPERLVDKPTSVGIPIPGTAAWLEGDDGRRCAFGETGELVVRGPHVMRGYWRDDELTARVFPYQATDGERLLYTGDLFRQDADGFFHFVSRRDNLIKSRGQKVYPVEIERVIREMDGVENAVVVSAPDPLLGHAIIAIVAASDPGVAEPEVRRYCSGRLEGYKVPQAVEIVESLPQTASGKIDRASLARLVRERRGTNLS
jgi:long-chain acyl-CoA synthetase